MELTQEPLHFLPRQSTLLFIPSPGFLIYLKLLFLTLNLSWIFPVSFFTLLYFLSLYLNRRLVCLFSLPSFLSSLFSSRRILFPVFFLVLFHFSCIPSFLYLLITRKFITSSLPHSENLSPVFSASFLYHEYFLFPFFITQVFPVPSFVCVSAFLRLKYLHERRIRKPL